MRGFRNKAITPQAHSVPQITRSIRIMNKMESDIKK